MNNVRIYEEADRLTLVIDGVSPEEKQKIKNIFSVNAIKEIASLLPAETPAEEPNLTGIAEIDVGSEAAIARAKALLADVDQMRKIGMDETIRILAQADRNESTINWLRNWDPSKDTKEKKLKYFSKLKTYILKL